MAPPTPWTARARLSIERRGREPADQRGEREDGEADGEHLAPAVDVAQDAGGQQERGQGQGVGVDHPLEVGEGRVQRPLDVGQRDVDHRDVEQQHEHRRADGDQGPPLAFERGHLRSVSSRSFALVQCAVIVGSALTIEIGDRTLLADASFVVGAGEKVGLVGRNGTGKSSFISVLVGEPTPQLRHRGNVRLLGSFGYLPQAPIPGGLGLEPTGFSHVLSARGLDVLDDALGTGPPCHGRRPLRGEHRALHRPAGAVPVQRRVRGRGGHGPPGRRPRPAPGTAPRGHRRAVGRPAPPGRPDAGALPGARADDPRRADQPPRPVGQALAARRAGALPGGAARGQPRPQAARPLHHQGAAHLEPAADRVEGQLLAVPGPARGRPGPA